MRELSQELKGSQTESPTTAVPRTLNGSTCQRVGRAFPPQESAHKDLDVDRV